MLGGAGAGMRLAAPKCYTLAETLEQVGILTGMDKPSVTAIVDKDYLPWREG